MADNDADLGAGTDAEVDWGPLVTAAREVMTSAYAPYSRYPVGAAGLTDDGAVVVGCNVENASYGVTLCAETGVVSALHATGGGRLVATVAVDGNGDVLTPCGRCRQLLYEHGGDDLLVLLREGPRPLREIFPEAFGPEHVFGRHRI